MSFTFAQQDHLLNTIDINTTMEASFVKAHKKGALSSFFILTFIAVSD